MEDVYICASCRTAIGTLHGQYSKISANKLGSAVLKKCLELLDLDSCQLSLVVIGQVCTAGIGQNPARQTSILAGCPPDVPAYVVNMLTGSGLKAIYEGYNAIRSKDASIVYAGGQENLSLGNHSANLRSKEVVGHVEWKDTVISDGLTDSFLNLHMGGIADDLATTNKVTRLLQDKFSMMSQTRAIKAIDEEYFFMEIVPVLEENDLAIDECPSRNVTLEHLTYLPNAFSLIGGSISSGNSAPLCDGAAGVIMLGKSEMIKRNLIPQVRIVAIIQIGCEPIEMGLAAIAAVNKVAQKADWPVKTVDLFEIDETYAVQAMLCVDSCNLDLDKVNVSGGAIALGNPLGASGVRMLVTLIYNLNRLNKSRGIVALCIGGGMGIGIAVERVLM